MLVVSQRMRGLSSTAYVWNSAASRLPSSVSSTSRVAYCRAPALARARRVADGAFAGPVLADGREWHERAAATGRVRHDELLGGPIAEDVRLAAWATQRPVGRDGACGFFQLTVAVGA
jgi:hypothetical protein